MNLDEYECNTRQAGILLPVKNIMTMIEVMNNYGGALRETSYNTFVMDFLNTFMQWLDGMANSKPKYYNIVMVENLHYILRNLEEQDE